MKSRCSTKKYQTILGRWFEKGHELSIGEWQRIALARASLRSGSVILLDEPTSSLDAEAEYMVFRELSKLRDDRITFLVSHRFSTARMADTILVFDKNQIVEAGSHEELMKSNHLYASLFNVQAKAYSSNALMGDSVLRK